MINCRAFSVLGEYTNWMTLYIYAQAKIPLNNFCMGSHHCPFNGFPDATLLPSARNWNTSLPTYFLFILLDFWRDLLVWPAAGNHLPWGGAVAGAAPLRHQDSQTGTRLATQHRLRQTSFMPGLRIRFHVKRIRTHHYSNKNFGSGSGFRPTLKLLQ